MLSYRKICIVAVVLAASLSSPALAQEESKKPDRAPDKFKVLVDTSKGKFTLEVTRSWAPIGADHFFELVNEKFYDDTRFFRVMPDFVAQWGINGDPTVHSKWKDVTIKDDPVVASNMRGFVTYAKTGAPNSRSTQLYINFGDNSKLDGMGFAPFARVVEGMEVVDKINSEYGQTPSQPSIEILGNDYLKEKFPNLDYIKTMRVVKPKKKSDAADSKGDQKASSDDK